MDANPNAYWSKLHGFIWEKEETGEGRQQPAQPRPTQQQSQQSQQQQPLEAVLDGSVFSATTSPGASIAVTKV